MICMHLGHVLTIHLHILTSLHTLTSFAAYIGSVFPPGQGASDLDAPGFEIDHQRFHELHYPFQVLCVVPVPLMINADPRLEKDRLSAFQHSLGKVGILAVHEIIP